MGNIEKLKKRVENNKERREADKKFLDYINARQILVDEAPLTQEMDFYCATCNEHGSYLGKKHIRYGVEFDKDMNIIGDYRVEPISALFIAGCKRGHRVERFITDKAHDPYFKSPILRKLARDMADEMLQPNDPRFAKVYPKQWAELQKQREEQMMMVEAQAELS